MAHSAPADRCLKAPMAYDNSTTSHPRPCARQYLSSSSLCPTTGHDCPSRPWLANAVPRPYSCRAMPSCSCNGSVRSIECSLFWLCCMVSVGKFCVHQACPSHRYEGQWLDDRRHGQGTFHHADGSRYEGEWAAGRKEGKGTLYFNNGDSFAGYWSEGVIQGPGVLTLREDSPWNLQDL